MSFWRRISPTGAARDFRQVWASPNPYRWRVLGLSVAITFAMLIVLIPESQRVEPRSPTITWITTWAEGRSEAEIIRTNIENQQRKDRLAAEAEKRAERSREAARALGRATFVDVDKLERQMADDPPAEAAAAKPAVEPAGAPGGE